MSCCVYWIRCQDHTDIFNQGYIGISKNANKRFEQHSKKTQNPHLAFAIKKYGWDNLVKSVLLIAEKDYCLDIENKLRPIKNIGWNCIEGGGMPPSSLGQRFTRKTPSWNKGKTSSVETKKKISDAVKLAMQNPARKEINRQLLKGKPGLRLGSKNSPETIEKMRLSKTGKPSKKKGIKLSPTACANIAAAARVKWCCPHCNKNGMSTGAANRWHFDACKYKEMT